MRSWKALALALAVKANGPQTPLEDGWLEDDWPGHDDDRQTCGSHVYDHETHNPVNATCTFTGLTNVRRLFLGQGAFIAPYAGDNNYVFYGLDGVTGEDVDVVVFWNQDFNAEGILDNGTCGTAAQVKASLSCTAQDPEGFPDGAYFMENINDHRHQSGEGQNYNFQVAGIGNNKWGHNGFSYVVDIKDHAGDDYPMTNITGIHLDFHADDGTSGGHLEMDEWGNWFSNTGTFSFTATEQHNSQLVHFFGTRVVDHVTEPDMWMSLVTQS